MNELRDKVIAEEIDKLDIDSNRLIHFLISTWSDILDIPKKEISIDDTFKELGGNSVKMYQFIRRLGQFLEWEIGAELFIYCRTIRQISDYMIDNGFIKNNYR